MFHSKLWLLFSLPLITSQWRSLQPGILDGMMMKWTSLQHPEHVGNPGTHHRLSLSPMGKITGPEVSLKLDCAILGERWWSWSEAVLLYPLCASSLGFFFFSLPVVCWNFPAGLLDFHKGFLSMGDCQYVLFGGKIAENSSTPFWWHHSSTGFSQNYKIPFPRNAGEELMNSFAGLFMIICTNFSQICT